MFLLFSHPCNSCFHRGLYTNSLLFIVNTLFLLISIYHFDQSPVFSDSTWHWSFVMVHRNPHPSGAMWSCTETDSKCHLRELSPVQHGRDYPSGAIAWFLITAITGTLSIASTLYLYHIVPVIDGSRQHRNPLYSLNQVDWPDSLITVHNPGGGKKLKWRWERSPVHSF